MPLIILFRGRAGVGKTHLSTTIGDFFNLPILRKDDIYDSIADWVPGHDNRNKACDKCLYSILQTNMAIGIDIILDVSWNHQNQIDAFRRMVKKTDYTLASFLCVCNDISVWKERFERRKNSPKPNNLITDFSQILKHYENVETEPFDGETLLDTSPDISILTKQVISTLENFLRDMRQMRR